MEPPAKQLVVSLRLLPDELIEPSVVVAQFPPDGLFTMMLLRSVIGLPARIAPPPEGPAFPLSVEFKKPALSVPEYEALHGGPLYKTNPDQCCFDRKVRVLRDADALRWAHRTELAGLAAIVLAVLLLLWSGWAWWRFA